MHGEVIELPYNKAQLFGLERCLALDSIYRLQNRGVIKEVENDEDW